MHTRMHARHACRHLQLHGTVVPNSTGVSFFRLDPSGRIAYVRESPEHFAKIADLAIPSLAVLSPLVELAQPLLRRPGDTAAAPLYSSQASPGHNPSYSESGAPRSHFSASQHDGAPAVFPDPMAMIVHAGEVASQHLTSFTLGTAQPDSQAHSAAAPPISAPTPLNKTPVDSGPAQVPVAQLRDQMRAAAVASSPRNPFAAAAAAAPNSTTPASMRPLTTNPDGPSSSVAVMEPAAAPPRAAAAAPPAPEGAREFDALSGVWQKDRALSDVDAYARCLDLMAVGGLQKTTALGIEGMEVNASADGGVFEVFYLTPVPFYKVKEAFRLDGETQNGRRDLRRGPQRGRARRDGGRAIVDVSWGEPHGGTGHEEYWLDDEGRLCAQSTVTVGGQSSTTLQVRRSTNPCIHPGSRACRAHMMHGSFGYAHATLHCHR